VKLSVLLEVLQAEDGCGTPLRKAITCLPLYVMLEDKILWLFWLSEQINGGEVERIRETKEFYKILHTEVFSYVLTKWNGMFRPWNTTVVVQALCPGLLIFIISHKKQLSSLASNCVSLTQEAVRWSNLVRKEYQPINKCWIMDVSV